MNGKVEERITLSGGTIYVEKERCVICGHDLINQVLSHEGGLSDRWSCPIHGTRGVKR